MKSKPRVTRRDIIALSDLVPRQDVKGGAGKRVFGAMSSPRPGGGRAGKAGDHSPARKAPR